MDSVITIVPTSPVSSTHMRLGIEIIWKNPGNVLNDSGARLNLPLEARQPSPIVVAAFRNQIKINTLLRSEAVPLPGAATFLEARPIHREAALNTLGLNPQHAMALGQYRGSIHALPSTVAFLYANTVDNNMSLLVIKAL